MAFPGHGGRCWTLPRWRSGRSPAQNGSDVLADDGAQRLGGADDVRRRRIRVVDEVGQPLRALRADAESRVALGDLEGAADRLRAGQRRARSGGAVDFIDVSVIDARLRDVEAQLRQRKLDEKSIK